MAQEQIGTLPGGATAFVGQSTPPPVTTPQSTPTRYSGGGSSVPPIAAPPRYSQPVPYSDPSKPTLGAVDENGIREQTRRGMQASIDAINANYTNLLASDRVQGQENLGETRALNARSGTLGSDFGNSALSKTKTANAQSQQTLVDQQNAQIQTVMNNIEDRAAQRIQSAKTDALNQYNIDSADYQQHLESAKADLKTLAESNVDLNTMSPEQQQALFKQAGYEPGMGALVYNAMKPKAAQIDYKFEKLADGQGLFYGTDPTTGQLVQQKVSVDLPPNWDMTIAPDGTVIGFDKTTGESRLMSDQGQFAKPELGTDGFALQPYLKTSYNGTAYVDLSSLSAKDKAAYAQLASQSGYATVLNTADSAKLNAIADAKTNLQNIQEAVNKIKLGSTSFTSDARGGPASQGLSNSLSKFFGNTDLKSFNAWRTAIINNVQALAGGAGSGLRINKAEIDAAMENDLPVVTGLHADTQESAAAKLKNLTSQLDTWEKQLVGGGNHASDTSSSQIIEYGGQHYHVDPQGNMTPFNQAGNASASNQVKAWSDTTAKLPLLNMDGSPKTPNIPLAKAYPPGSYPTGKPNQLWNQCGYFVRSIVNKQGLTYPSLGDSLQSKIAAVSKYGVPISQAKTGSVLVTSESKKNGHVAYVIGKTSQGFVVAESNFHLDGKVNYGRVIPFNSPKLVGIINPHA